MTDLFRLMPVRMKRTEHKSHRLWIEPGRVARLSKHAHMKLMIDRVDDRQVPTVIIVNVQGNVQSLVTQPVECGCWIDLTAHCGAMMLARAERLDADGRVRAILFEFVVVNAARLEGVQ